MARGCCLRLVVAAVVVLLGVSEGTKSEVYAEAKVAVAARCEGDFVGEYDATEGRKVLEDAIGGSNWLVEEVLVKATNSDEIGTKFTEYFENEGPALVVSRAAGLVMFVIMLVVWPFCCCTACCTGCRCCKNPGESSKLVKWGGAGCTAILGVAFLVCFIIATQSYQTMDDGLSNLGCTSARFVDATLSGQTDPAFIGLGAMVDQFEDLGDTLDEGSDFVESLTATLDVTKPIEQSTYLASQTLQLLVSSMTLNQKPGGHHDCLFCSTVADELAPVISVLDASLAESLAEARQEAQTQLSEANRQEMKDLLIEGLEPLTETEKLIADSFQPLVDEDSWNEIEQYFGSYGSFFSHFYALLALLHGIIAIFAMTWFCLKEKNGETYSRVPDRCSCCNWCCAWVVILLCFLFGGVLQLLVVPLSTVCLTLEDVSGDLLVRTSAALEIDSSGDEFVMLKDIVDKCLNPADFNVRASFADIIFTRDGGQKKTLRQRLEDETSAAINGEFDQLTAKLEANTGTNLAGGSEIVSLRELLRDNAANIAETIAADRPAITQELQAVSITAPGDSWLGWATTVQCAGQTPPGITEFITYELTSSGSTQEFQPCGVGTGVGSDCTVATDASQCQAANKLLELKSDLRTDQVFRCDVFASPTDANAECDVWAAGWSNCLQSDGTFRPLQVQCTLAEFAAYVQAFDIRIDFAFREVDTTTQTVLPSISEDLRNLVNTHVLDPITKIVDSVTCNFLGEHYQNTVNAMCYQGVYGMERLGSLYVAEGFLLTISVLVMYALWRRTADNVNAQKMGQPETPPELNHA